MCGIVAYRGKSKCLPIIKNILQKLEYRGYDSCGVSYILNNQLITFKSVGSVKDLIHNYLDLESETYIAIGHTRWATHGHPSTRNAHPHYTLDGRLSLVHNGIIENYAELKGEMKDKGYHLLSDTDSEVLLYIIYDYLMQDSTRGVLEATKLALKRVIGAYAIVVLDKHSPNTLVVARKGSPLVIGIGQDKEYYVASDSGGLADFTSNIVYVEDDTIIKLDDSITSYSLYNNEITDYNISKIDYELCNINKGSFDHFMIKEIYEQSKVVEDCISGRLDTYRIKLGGLDNHKEKLKNISTITILACGSSYYSGLIGKYYFEEFCGIKTNVEYASEFAYRKPVIDTNDIIIAISQSGETADLLKSIELAKNKGAFVIGICNVVNSSLSRLTDCGVFCRAGVEIGVASTKGFVSQIIVLLLISLWIDQNNKNNLMNEYRQILVNSLKALPEYIQTVLKSNTEIKNLANKYYKSKRFLFVGREYNYPIALEGALKLKEVAYVNAEGYAASELKHGPMALIDKNTVVVVLCNNSKQYSRMINSIQEISARDGKIIEICNPKKLKHKCLVMVPEIIDPLSPILSVIVLQLFSYYCALLHQHDPDKPRNLAKSVTVE